MSLPYEEFIGRGPCKFITEFLTISTDHCNQTGAFFVLKCFVNTSINKKPVFFPEVVTYRKTVLSGSLSVVVNSFRSRS